MAHAGFGGALDTPRTAIGDATYLSRPPDFGDITQEPSFQSPGKDGGDLLQQLRNGRSNGVSLRTPRQRGPLADRRNLPPSVGGAEFTPLLKSATRNSVRRNGKENGAAVPNTPALLGRIDEDDMTPVPRMDMSMYSGSREQSYYDRTLPQVDSSSVASTPMALRPRQGGDKGPLNDGNQLSLREQENVIDRIEKENFGLKLKIHFLEEALRKAGPGFSEAALKENTDLKVDKVTMQRELHKYKKHISTAEKDLESYRQQMLDLQEKAKRKVVDEGQKVELEELRQALEERENDIEDLQRRLAQEREGHTQLEKLQDDVGDLEADLREKDRIIGEKEDELEDLRDKIDEAEDRAKDMQRKVREMEENAQQSEELEEAKDTISDLEASVRRLEEQIDELKEKADDATAQKNRAEGDLEELQEEMANKSTVTKGLSRQIEEKVTRLQEELDQSSKEYADLERDLGQANRELEKLQTELEESHHNRDQFEREKNDLAGQIQELETELLAIGDERDLLQTRQDALAGETGSLQHETERLEKEVQHLQTDLAEEKEHALRIEKDLREQYQDEMQKLNDEISDLQAEVREKDNLYDNDSEKWDTEKASLESERQRAEEKAAGLQRTVDRLRETEGSLSSKETQLQEALQSENERHKSEEGILSRQIDDLQDALETRQTLLTNLRNELSAVRDELRQTQMDYQSQANKVLTLEDEVEILQGSLNGASSKGQDLEASRKEVLDLREQLRTLRRAAVSSPAKTSTSEPDTRIQRQLADAQSQLDRATRDKQLLQSQLASAKTELESVSNSLAETMAERDELDGQRKRTNHRDNDTLRLDQERLDLRTAKMKLDNEVRRLRDDNKLLSDQHVSLERTLEEEIGKAAAEEERLSQEIMGLQSKLRSAGKSESGELVSARRQIRDLERCVEDYQTQLASSEFPSHPEGNSELSLIRKDLGAARQKEVDFLQREAAHRDLVKGLKRQITDLERKTHHDEVSRLIESPRSTTSESRRGNEVNTLRNQLSAAQKSIHDLKTKTRESERKAGQDTLDLQTQLNDLEDQKLVLEEVLDEARQQAEETAAQHERLIRRMQHKLDKAERDRGADVLAKGDGSKKQLRRTQAEVENLEHDVKQQQEMLEALVSSEAALRRKLERARSERAAYRMSAEKLQRDIRHLQRSTSGPVKKFSMGDGTDQALETVVRAAESAEERHKKEVKGMVTQMEWMQKRWEREASLRNDAAWAKRFVQLQLEVAQACNKAQLRELEHIRKDLLGSRRPLPSGASLASSPENLSPRQKLRTFLIMGRFIARAKLSAGKWATQEAVRRKLVVATEEGRRRKKMGHLRVVRVSEEAA